MGNLGEAMKKILLFIFSLTASLHADRGVEELKKQVCLVLPSLEGWCSREKALNFIDLVLQTKPEVCVEIGVFGGASLFPVACALQHLDHGVVIGIDAWDRLESLKHLDPKRDDAQFKWWSGLDLEAIYQNYLKVFKRFGLEPYCKTILSSSQKAAAQVGNIDILHLDGGHSRSVCTQDVKLYLPKVRPGGYIWLNDSLWEEMQEGIELMLDSCDVVKLIDNGNCILFRKR